MSKVGGIYQLLEVAQKRYFQLAALDTSQLNSDVIAVFSYQGDVSEKPSTSEIDKIIQSGVEFFTHTVVNAGVSQKHWRKIGKTDPVSVNEALFKDAHHDGVPDSDTYGKGDHGDWVIWKVGGERVHIGADLGSYPSAELGWVYPPSQAVYRIKHGKYPGVKFYNQER